MLNLRELFSDFDDTVVFSAVQKESLDCIEGLLLCAPSITEISDRHVYIGLPEEADRLLAVWDGKSYLNLVVAACTDPRRYKEASRLNLVVSSLPLAELYNRLFNNINLYHWWEKQLETVPVSDGSLGRLLRAAISVLDFKVSLYILSPAFRLVESCAVDKSTDQITRRLETGGYLTADQVNFLLDSMSEEKKTVCRTEPIMGDNDLLGYLVMVEDTDARVPEGFIKMLLRFIAAHITKTAGFIPFGNRELVKLLSDIFVFMPKDVDTIQYRLKNLPYKLDKYIRLVLVARSTEDRSLWKLASELKNVFPRCNIAPYDKYVVILLSIPNLLYRPKFDEDTFETLLKKYNAYAIISQATRFILGLRTFFIQSKQMLELLPLLDITDGKRHTYFEDISEYYLVYLCDSCMMEHYGHDRLVYFAHPAITVLMRYDSVNGTDFCDFLFSYINNDCSILKTAEAMYLHRNTVSNKLNRIKELFGIDLNDNFLRRKLLFSCKIMRYAERVKHQMLYPDDLWRFSK